MSMLVLCLVFVFVYMSMLVLCLVFVLVFHRSCNVVKDLGGGSFVFYHVI